MANGSETENEPKTIRVLTFNILSADRANWERRREAARTGLQALRPDNVALQETTPGQARNQETDLHGPDYHVAEHPHSGDMVGAALVSRWPFAAVREVDLSVAPRVPFAAAVVAEVKMPWPFVLTVLVHHAAAYQFGYAREREMQAVAVLASWRTTWPAEMLTSYSLVISTTLRTHRVCGFGLADSPWRV